MNEPSSIDRWTNTATLPGAEEPAQLPRVRTEKLSRVNVQPSTKALLIDLGTRDDLGPASVAAHILEELVAQGMLAQTWRAHCNRRRRKLYQLRYGDRHQDPARNNPCGCGANCEDRGPLCRYLYRTEGEDDAPDR